MSLIAVEPTQHVSATARKPLTVSTHRPEWVSSIHGKEDQVLLSRLTRTKQLNSLSEPSFADCNRRKPGGILGAGQHLGWEMR